MNTNVARPPHAEAAVAVRRENDRGRRAADEARSTAARSSFGRSDFERDCRELPGGLFRAGCAPDAIVTGGPTPDAGFAVGAAEGFAGQSRAGFQRHVLSVRAIAGEAGVFYAPVNERTTEEGGILADHVHPDAERHANAAAIFAGAARLPPT